MGMFDFLFKSDRDEQAPKYTQEQLNRLTALLGDLGGMQSEFSGVNNLQDVQSQYGLSKFDMPGYKKQVGEVYAPQRRNLATNRARSMSRIASRMTGGEATPEFAYTPAESEYAMQLGNLRSAQAGSELEGFDKEMQQNQFLANFFKNLKSQKEGFGTWKKGLQFQGEGQRQGAVGDYLGSLDDSSLFEDLTGVASTVSKFIPFAGLDPMKILGGGSSTASSRLTGGLDRQIQNVRKRGYTL